MRHLASFALFLALVATPESHALSVLEIELEAPLAMERCTESRNAPRPYAMPSRTCWHPVGEWKSSDRVKQATVLYGRTALPEFVRIPEVSVTLLDNKVVAIRFETFGADRINEALPVLSGKFGEMTHPPTNIGTSLVAFWDLQGGVKVTYQAPLDSEWGRMSDNANVEVVLQKLDDYLRASAPKPIQF